MTTLFSNTYTCIPATGEESYEWFEFETDDELPHFSDWQLDGANSSPFHLFRIGGPSDSDLEFEHLVCVLAFAIKHIVNDFGECTTKAPVVISHPYIEVTQGDLCFSLISVNGRHVVSTIVSGLGR